MSLLYDRNFDITGYLPPLNLYDTEKEYFVELELPGVSKDAVDIELRYNNLVISGKKDILKEKKDQEKFSPLRQEIREGDFQRIIQLPRGVQNDMIQACMKDGLLCVKISKPEKGAGKETIPISYGESSAAPLEKGQQENVPIQGSQQQEPSKTTQT